MTGHSAVYKAGVKWDICELRFLPSDYRVGASYRGNTRKRHILTNTIGPSRKLHSSIIVDLLTPRPSQLVKPTARRLSASMPTAADCTAEDSVKNK